jgi:hypothetical protein
VLKKDKNFISEPIQAGHGANRMDEQKIAFINHTVLISEFMSKLESMWFFFASTHDHINRLEKEWYGPNVTISDKLYMKQRWGTTFAYRTFLKELSIIGISKIVEDLIGEAKRLLGVKFNIWKNDSLNLPYHHQVRYVRALNNVIKHDQSTIVDDGGSNYNFLIHQCGLKAGQIIVHIDFDVARHIFYAWTFLESLTVHLTKLDEEEAEVESEDQAFRSFEKIILPEFIRDWQEGKLSDLKRSKLRRGRKEIVKARKKGVTRKGVKR